MPSPLPMHIYVRDKDHFQTFFQHYTRNMGVKYPWLLNVSLLFDRYAKHVGSVLTFTDEAKASIIRSVLVAKDWSTIEEADSHLRIIRQAERKLHAVISERYGCYWIWPLQGTSGVYWGSGPRSISFHHRITLGNINNGDQIGIYIGRESRSRAASPLGNPFKISARMSRKDVIAAYEPWLRRQLADVHSAASIEMRRLAALIRYTDIHLLCYCAPQACHGAIIRKIIYEGIK